MAMLDKKHQLKEANWEGGLEDEKRKAATVEQKLHLKEIKARAKENKVKANMMTEENRSL
jgi:hypothetical protein